MSVYASGCNSQIAFLLLSMLDLRLLESGGQVDVIYRKFEKFLPAYDERLIANLVVIMFEVVHLIESLF